MLTLSKTQKSAAIVIIVVLSGLLVFVSLRQKPPEPPIIPVAEIKNNGMQYAVIGNSVEGRKIESYTFGQGATELVFVGGIHGGYEWNSVLLAYQAIDYFTANPTIIPDKLKVTIIPSANPDAVYKVVGKEGRFLATDVSTNAELLAKARFNAHAVDLNRNFACKWQPKSTWRNKIVSAGTSAFSEPEAVAIRDFMLAQKPAAAVFWHSQSNAVYASECQHGILPQTLGIMNAYAKAANYPSVEKFDAYPITGDAEGWLASINIPAITVELSTHQAIEWDKNLAGIKAVLEYYHQ